MQRTWSSVVAAGLCASLNLWGCVDDGAPDPVLGGDAQDDASEASSGTSAEATSSSTSTSGGGDDDESEPGSESGSGEGGEEEQADEGGDGEEEGNEEPPPAPDCGMLDAPNWDWTDQNGVELSFHHFCEDVLLVVTGSTGCTYCTGEAAHALSLLDEHEAAGLKILLVYQATTAGPATQGQRQEKEAEIRGLFERNGGSSDHLQVQLVSDPDYDFLWHYFPDGYSTSNRLLFSPGLVLEAQDNGVDSSPLTDDLVASLVAEYAG